MNRSRKRKSALRIMIMIEVVALIGVMAALMVIKGHNRRAMEAVEAFEMAQAAELAEAEAQEAAQVTEPAETAPPTQAAEPEPTQPSEPAEAAEEDTDEQNLPTTEPVDPYAGAETPMERMEVFAEINGLSLTEDWPDYVVELLLRNPDAEEYVLNYPLLKGTSRETDLSDLVGTGEVPQLYQWDARWGYTQYGDKEMGLTACGPTCLSMVCLYFLEDARYTPRYIADYAEENGYYAIGAGTQWVMMSEGAADLGLNVTVLPMDIPRILRELEQGNLVILSVGPGDFTPGGHFILLTGVEDDKVIVHDPNSPTNTAKLWDLEQIQSQICNIWLYTPVE